MNTWPCHTTYIPYSENFDPDLVSVPDNNDPIDSNVKAVFEKPIIDELIYAELHLPQREKLMSAKVIDRTHDDDDNLNINQIKLESSSMEPSYLLVSSL